MLRTPKHRVNNQIATQRPHQSASGSFQKCCTVVRMAIERSTDVAMPLDFILAWGEDNTAIV